MGRPQGTANKNKAFLLSRLQRMFGEDFHPIMEIAKNCVQLQGIADKITIEELPLEAKAEEVELWLAARNDKVTAIKSANFEWARMAEYTEPKLKAIEHTGPDGGPIQTDSVIEFIGI